MSVRVVTMLTSMLALGLLWHFTSGALDDRSLPSPYAVWQAFLEEWQSGELIFHLMATLARVAAAFLLAMSIGSCIGILLGSYKSLNTVFDGWLVLLLNIPALVIIVLSYIWFGLNEVAAVCAVALNKIPNVVITMREGARSVDSQLNEMATVYRFGLWKKIRHVLIPQLQPFFAAATRSGISLIWKIVLVVELLGRSNGVGFQIQLYFQLFDVATILAYTFAFVFVMLAIEYLLLQPMERMATRWRPSSA
ncbi:MAG: ABC transporter permease [Gammaproteobacteria bacterium]|nr:ABC transporter permease [Gammaproteobacteria bacterium]